MNVIFVNYGLFNSNSGGHVAHFANELTRQGAKVLVIGSNDPRTASDFGPVNFDALQMPAPGDDLPSQVLDFACNPSTIVHAWTPRGNVLHFVRRLTEKINLPYVVHLEDNEKLLLAASLKMDIQKIDTLTEAKMDEIVPPTLSHPYKSQDFLSCSAGISAIVEPLLEFAPVGKPTHILEPGVDTDQFCCDMPSEEKKILKEKLYIDNKAIVTVYNGNTHAANHRDIFSLYASMLILRRRGLNVNLIRTGKDYFNAQDTSFSYLDGDWVVNLGVLPRQDMINILKVADFYVQPGARDEFNKYRLPSKLPEFLALGKPVILPAANIGERLSDGENALLLFRGDGTEIADKVDALLRSGRANVIGRAGREFAKSNFNWAANAASLMQFYKNCQSSTTKSAL